MKRGLFGKHTPHESIRIARAGGIVLAGVGLTAACLQIASTTDTKEKNEIFVETITSTGMEVSTGSVVGLFLISNPVGWGTAIVLAVGSVAVSYGLGKFARGAYDTFGKEIDLVEGIGIDRICK